MIDSKIHRAGAVKSGRKGVKKMAKTTTVKWKCDVCGKEVEAEKDIRETSIPSYAGENSKYYTDNNVDLCLECSKKLREVISKHFAHIVDNYGTITVRKPE